MTGRLRIAAAALVFALAAGVAAAAFAASSGSRATAALVTLEVAPRGPGSISTSTPGGVDLDSGSPPAAISGPCTNSTDQQECHWGFPRGTTVTLTAHPTGTGLTRWSLPDCPGTSSCSVKLDDDVTTVVGQFSPLSLGVVLSSPGLGTVTSVPTGINCSSDPGVDPDGCMHDFPANTAVKLTEAGGNFQGWNPDGNCTPVDSHTCTIVVDDQPTWAGGYFSGDQPPNLATTIDVKFQIKKGGNGSGTVTANNINCGAQCTAQFTYGKTLTLTANTDSGSEFDGWGGLCPATAKTCTFPVGPVTRVKTVFTRDATPPTVPGGLAVTAATLTSISLQWSASTDNIGVAGYRVYNGTATVADVNATQYTVTGLACSHTYSLSVDAADGVGNRSAKATIAAGTKPCHLAARVAGLGVRNTKSGRSVVLQLRVNRSTSALLTLKGRGRKVASGRYKVKPGTNVLRLGVRRSVARGSYRLTVSVVDPDGGAPVVFSRGVSLPKAK